MGPNREDPSYIKAVVEKKGQSDPKEVAIRDKIRNAVMAEDWARAAFSEIGEMQIRYLRKMIANSDKPEFIHDSAQQALKEISRKLRSTIVEGENELAQVPKGSPMLIITNHFGAYKLTSVSPRGDLGVDIPNYEAMYPYFMYFAALYPVAEAVEDNLYYASVDYPLIFGEIHTKAGYIYVPPPSLKTSEGRTGLLIKQTKDAIDNRHNVAIVNFPEGGTSGKYSGLGPYDLSPFKKGGYVIAANLGIYAVPVAQYFDKSEGFQLKVLKPFIPPQTDRKGYEQMAEGNRKEMQTWLDERVKITES